MKKIEILGIGCRKCEKTAEVIKKTVIEMGLLEGEDFEMLKVKDPVDIASRGVLMTPGVSIDGKVVCSGKIPGKALVQSWFK